MMSAFRLMGILGIAILAAAACGDGENGGAKGGPDAIVVDYPLDGSVFPPEFVPPTFLWHDPDESVAAWRIEIAFEDGEPGLQRTTKGGPPPAGRIDPDALRENNRIYEGTEYQRSANAWTPDAETWAEIKRRSIETKASISIVGLDAIDPGWERTRGSVTITTSRDPVGAPIFYRDVPLMPAVGKKGAIQPLAEDAIPLINWRLRDVSRPESRVVLKNMPSCANCHSFSNDGKTMGMDVDGPDGDKGAYMIAPVGEEMEVTDEEVITWNGFKDKPKDHRTFGLLSRISPDGTYAVTTLNESLYVVNFRDFRFLQVFYPTRGILAWYSNETKEMAALPGADDTDYVHCSPVWTPDGKTVVFSRAKAFDPYQPGRPLAKRSNDPNEPQIRYDLYRVPFNDGKGGKPVRIEGASANGMSNTFPKVSPDGKWLVWTMCRNGLLMRPDGRLWIVPLEGGEPREMNCNTPLMNSWHSFSPNGRWMVFSSKSRTPYTQMFLTHIDENGHDTPAILIPNSTAANRAVNIPEFLNADSDAIRHIDVPAVRHHRLYRDAKKLVQQERYAEAMPLALQALAKEPDFVRARVLLGWCLIQTDRLDEGMKELGRVFEYDPINPAAYHHLGLTYERLGQKDKALQCFELAVKHGPGVAEAWKSLGFAQFEKGNFERAQQAYEMAVLIRPNDPAGHESLAAVLMKRGDVRRALGHLGRVCALTPKNANTRVFLAMQLASRPEPELRDGRQAVAIATDACRLTGWRHPAALDALAAAQAEAGQWDKAVKTARRAIGTARKVESSELPEYRKRLALYEKRQPYRQAVRRETWG
jgi:tetratricopeptide (TPR) repeat protein